MKGLSLARFVLVAWLPTALADTTSSATSSSSGSSTGTNSGTATTVSSIAAQLTEIPTDSRATYPSADVTSTLASSGNATAGLSSTNQTASSSSSSAARETFLHGSSVASSSLHAPTSGSVRCNGYAEFCDRKYSNVTYVVAHNSPFHRAHNAASNQDFDVTTQLDNGIRGSE
jgi:hypothetical protein